MITRLRSVSVRTTIGALVVVGSLLLGSGCGTLIYPERRGQTSGDLDPGIVFLDGIGLLFFIVPGLIAFGVDFTSGAIYEPGTQTSSTITGDADGAYAIRYVDPALLDAATIAAIISEHVGQTVTADQLTAISAEQFVLLAAPRHQDR